MKRNLPLPTLALAAILILAAACGPKPSEVPTGEPTPPPTEPPVIVPVGLPAAVDRSMRLDPAIAADPDVLSLCSLVYDGLTRLDPDGNLVPALALSWTVSDDQLDYILTLRQGVTFQGGSTFDADTVLANFNRWFDPANPLHIPDQFSAWQIEFLGFKGENDDALQPIASFDGIEKVDHYTVLIHLNRPVPDLMTKLAQPAFLMLDPLLLATAGENYGASQVTVNGTGAYLLSAWSDSGLTFTPNASYWGTTAEGELQVGWK